MSDKLTEQKIDKMIEELLQEKSSDPLDIEFDNDKLRYHKGEETVHQFDNTNSTRRNRTNTKPSRTNLASLSVQDAPNNKLNVKDIKKVLYKLAHGTVNSVRKNTGTFKDWLYLSKKDLEERGTSSEKKYWNAALALLIQDYKREIDQGDSRYKMFSKSKGGINYKSYAISGVEFKDQKYYKNNWLAIEFDPEPAEKQTIEFPEETPTQADSDLFNLNIASNPSELGKFPTGVANSVDTVFAGTTNMVQRMRMVTSISQEFAQPRGKTIESVGEMGKEYAKVVFYDYINEIARNMDERVSAYLFESFLALCAGGRVEGAQAAEGSSTMGATDFTMGKQGIKGSCKYYSSKDGISQAISGFTSEVPMHYIIAIKTKETTPGEQKILKDISLFYIKVLVEKLQTKTNVSYFSPNGQRIHYMSIPKKGPNSATDIPLHFDVLYRSETSLGEIELLEDNREEYKDAI